MGNSWVMFPWYRHSTMAVAILLYVATPPRNKNKQNVNKQVTDH